MHNFNPGRGDGGKGETQMHQIESELLHLDIDLFHIFEGPFWDLGQDQSCGWAHYPPVWRWEYDWACPDYGWTDCENWKPDGTGERVYINCERWGCNGEGFFTWWMQNIPGKDNDLYYNGKKLKNWWDFIGDWDNAILDPQLTYEPEESEGGFFQTIASWFKNLF